MISPSELTMHARSAIDGRVALLKEDIRSLANIRSRLGDKTPPIYGDDVRHVEEAIRELQWWLDHTTAYAAAQKEAA